MSRREQGRTHASGRSRRVNPQPPVVINPQPPVVNLQPHVVNLQPHVVNPNPLFGSSSESDAVEEARSPSNDGYNNARSPSNDGYNNASDSDNMTLSKMQEKGLQERSERRRREKGKSKVRINRNRETYVPILDGPRPGGPEIVDLLISYDTHVAGEVWVTGNVSYLTIFHN